MPNPSGRNGYGNQQCPLAAELKAALLRYAAQRLPAELRIANLKSDLNYSIRQAVLGELKELQKKFQIPSARKPPPLKVSRQAVIDKVQQDSLQGNGPNYFKTLLQQEGIMIPRDTIRKIMHEHFPLGFDNRFPGKKKSTIPRTALNSNGPYHEVSSDGHEKLGKQALDMGDIGLPIYRYKDKWSDDVLLLQFVPNSRTSAAIGHLYLDFIETTGAIPIQMTTDKGSEIGWQYAIQDTLRDAFAPDIDPIVYLICRIIKSVHNTIIEGFWRWLKEKMGPNLKAVILVGKDQRIFSANVDFHLPLFYWIFVPLLQAKLDEFRLWWNQHRVRMQKDKNMPSAHVPQDVLDHPHNYGGMDCRIPVPQEAINDIWKMMDEDVGPRENHLSWFTVDFDELAHDIHQQIG
ncbi:hypothetical protein DFH07DRAFT_870974 [Mycena maculata]|uniref:Integrase core domain-containing protein n=1 Tax=Mycena maculata TaxID=230809 RepID=A0AAD7I2E4_9AGAR|nr:hypothetical protein DFH07DRAFT_870974 [Mycena maculata]